MKESNEERRSILQEGKRVTEEYMKSKVLFFLMLGIAMAFLLSACAKEATESETVKATEPFSIEKGVYSRESTDFLISTEEEAYEFLASCWYDDHVEDAKKDYVIADVVVSDDVTYYIIRQLLDGKEVYGTEMLMEATPSSSSLQGATYIFTGNPDVSKCSKEECIALVDDNSYTPEKEVYYIQYSEEYYNVSGREASALGIDIPEMNSGWLFANDSATLLVNGNTKEIFDPEELYARFVANSIASMQ